MNKIILVLTLITLLLASACVPVAPAAEAPASAVTAATIHQMSITATTEGWDAPESVPAGWTEITLTNQSEGMRQAGFFRLDDDKTMDDVFAAIQAGLEGIPEWMTSYGGPAGVLPSGSLTVASNLAAGQYIVIDPVPEQDGVPGMAKGYFMPLVVEESEAVTAAPEADMTLELVDYAFIFDQNAVRAGRQIIEVTNSGPQEAHEVTIIKLNDEASVQDFLAAMGPDAPAGPPPGMPIGGTGAFDTITQNYLDVTLEAGATYGLVCFIPSTEQGGMPHFMLGMVGQFTVAN